MNHITCFDFNGLYESLCREGFPRRGFLSVCIDCGDIRGTHGYCAPEAAREILDRMRASSVSLPGTDEASEPVQRIHLIDNGNYHYMTHLMMRDIKTPYTLILIDHHPDLRQAAFSSAGASQTASDALPMLSCGGWVLSSLQTQCFLQRVILIGVDETLWEEERTVLQDDCFIRPAAQYTERIPVRRISYADDAPAEEILRALHQALPADEPVYLSVDKDVLSDKEIDTNWDQGKMRLDTLCTITAEIARTYQLFGSDICGAPDGYSASAAALLQNRTADERLIAAVTGEAYTARTF